MQLVISAFPGCGKSTICKEAEQYGLVHVPVSLEGTTSNRSTDGKTPIFDSDSSLFAKEHFPGNYIEHIKEVLKGHPDVVIMVSSHDNVREAMREAGIEYTLVAPQRELKGEYLERYQGRGSPEAFITMMENKWNDFIDSIENDPSTSKLVLSEGEYLVDKISDRIKETVKNMSVEGNESIDGFKDIFTGATDELKAVIANNPPVTITEDGSTAGTTAVIIDVNADANNPDVIQPEASGEVIVSIVNQPESIEDSTLIAGKLEGGVIAVDASTVDDSAMAGDNGISRSELVGAKHDIETDIGALEGLITIGKDPEHSGFESMTDNGEILMDVSKTISERYGIEIEPTLSGVEGFLDSLKVAFGKITEKLKKQPNKQELAVIKKYLFESDKAANVYAGASWQDTQQFKNVGKAKFSVPQSMSTVTTPDSVKTILNGLITIVDKEYAAYLSNAKQRMVAGVKVFNKYKNKSVPEDMGPVNQEIKKMLPIKPDIKPAPIMSVFEAVLDTAMVKGEIPVLRKDDIKEVVDILLDITRRADKYENEILDIVTDGISWDDINDSELWDEVDDSILREISNSAEWENATTSLNMLEEIYTKKMLVIAKFLEQWILNSVK